MLRSFSWQGYCVVVGFLKQRIKASRVSPELPNGEVLFRLSQAVIKELRTGIREIAIRQQGKEDLLLLLRRLLEPYTVLLLLPFRIAINNFIVMETETHCSIHLNEEELLMLWRK